MVFLPGDGSTPERDLVGGKAHSLFQMAAAGLKVPPGAVLTTHFFAPWYTALAAKEPWQRLHQSESSDIPAQSEALITAAQTLDWTDSQLATLDRVAKHLAEQGLSHLMIVRSSASDEDGAVASFAGIYETIPGVTAHALADAVRRCFLASLEPRVFQYRRQRRLEGDSARLAVVVQPHLPSDVSGVGFSINPQTNDYDEILLTANWGQGESVVAGIVEPDTFVVEKETGQCLERTPGTKATTLWLDQDGGLLEKSNDTAGALSLSDAQCARLNQIIQKTAAYFAHPVDVEWTFVGDTLYLLQARPISVYVPLPANMVTAPGERRRLYADAALSKGITLNAPMSPLGLDWVNRLFFSIIEAWVGPVNRHAKPEDALFFCTGGRMYINYANLLIFSRSEKLAKNAEATDTLTADILKAVDTETYRAAKTPKWIGPGLLLRAPRMMWRLASFGAHILPMLVFPKSAHRRATRKVQAVETQLRQILASDLPIDQCADQVTRLLVSQLFNQLMPMLLCGMLPAKLAVSKPSMEQRLQLDQLQRGFDEQVVVAMGLALFQIGSLMAPSDFEDLPETAARLRAGTMPPKVQEAWRDFVDRFGFRGPGEMDLATPKYADDPLIALNQIVPMIESQARYHPQKIHQHQVEARIKTYQILRGRLGMLRRSCLAWLYRRWCLFIPERDKPKHLITLCNGGMRRKAEALGQKLVDAGRLDRVADVFGLTLDELVTAVNQPEFDVREAVKTNTAFTNKLRTHVRHFPPVIDSRGRILRPESTSDSPHFKKGSPVSPGVVRGPVKVLHQPDEKKVEPGDILVAYTTDPGWTPLFFNAGAVVLEVGGILQHGAVVARELGKPCVAGIADIVRLLKDGQEVEVDGNMGSVKIL